MYRGFKTYRHFLNYQLHALSAIICGDDTVIDEELARRGFESVKQLNDREAELLYRQLKEVVNKLKSPPSELKLSPPRMTDKQRKAILKLARYTFNWSDEALISYIFDMYPDKRKRLNNWEIKNANIHKIFNMLSIKEADKVIKRLDKIKARNESKN
ncbi:MAG: DUF1018 domain-containing protein [Ignavibacterium sp.]|nr:DUF1018 domain-containing protein [Ignavibacterium sp.]MDW8376048.1 DUF1018 domain-containing protein [Ignavibacteriales bacterium]